MQLQQNTQIKSLNDQDIMAAELARKANIQ